MKTPAKKSASAEKRARLVIEGTFPFEDGSELSDIIESVKAALEELRGYGIANAEITIPETVLKIF